MKTAKFVVSGVCCATEEHTLQKSLDAELGPGRYRYNGGTCELAVDTEIDPGRVVSLVRRAGFDARAVTPQVPEDSFFRRHRHGIAVSAATVLVIAGLGSDDGSGSPLVSRAFLLAGMIVGGWTIVRRAIGAIRVRALDMNVLMTAAAIGAVALGKWAEGAAVILFFSISLMLESYSTARTRRAVRSLLDLSPDQARVLDGRSEMTVAASSVEPGSRIVIRPGDRIPLDGIVEEGSSGVNEAAITGEADTVEKSAGDTVFAGSINDRGTLVVRTTRRFEETTLARVVHLIEESQLQRAPIQLFVDRFARVYTPVVLISAAAVALIPPILLHAPVSEWVYRGLVLLVIACPCALVIATPVTLISAVTNAARNGILVKGGRVMETLARVRAVAFDKTGTLTRGRPAVTDLVPLDTVEEIELLRSMAAIEYYSEHHLASALLGEAQARGIEYRDLRVDAFEALPGKGVSAVIGARRYVLGNEALAKEHGLWSPAAAAAVARLAGEGKMVLLYGEIGRPLAVVGARDTMRHGGGESVAALRSTGVDHTVMISGDREEATSRIAAEAGVSEHRSGLLPEEKVASVRELNLRWGTVAMIGDGVNDAPALAASSVGIAMGVSGADVSLESADVVLLSDDLRKLPHLFSLSRAAMRAIRQNIVFALGLKLLFLLLTVAGEATLWMAVLADDGAAIAVILNGLRLLSFRAGNR